MLLHHKTYGTADQPAVIIVHGLFGTLDNWHNISQSLSDRFFVVAMDMRNHGKSNHTSDMNYTVMANDVVETAEHLGLSSASFIGHSMGGKVCMQLAIDHPGWLDKLVVADIAPKAYPSGHHELMDAMEELDLTTFTRRSEIDEALSNRIPDQTVRLFLMKNITRSDEGNYTWKMNLPVIRAAYPEIIGAIHSDWPVSVPTLFVKGERSGYITASDELEISELFPLAEFATIPQAGHWLHADNPEEFLNVVGEFLG